MFEGVDTACVPINAPAYEIDTTLTILVASRQHANKVQN